MFPKIGTSFGTLMVWDGALANKNTSHPEAIGIEVWTKKLKFFSNDFHFNQFKVVWIHPNLGKVVGTVESSWNVLAGRNLHNEMKVQKKKTQTKTITDLKLILDISVPFSTFSDYSLDTLHLSLM